MKTLRLCVFSTVIVASYVWAQDVPIGTKQDFLPDGYVEIAITNHSKQPITALVLTSEHFPLVNTVKHFTTIRWVDSIFSLTDRPLMPNDTQAFKYGGPNPGPDRMRVEIKLEAAIFEDGSTFGDPTWIERLTEGRRFLYEHLGTALKVLQAAQQTGDSREQLIQAFGEREQTRLAAARSREDERAIRTVFGTVRANLEQGTAPGGTPIAVDRTIQAVIQQFLQRRQRLLASKPAVAQQGESVNPVN